MKSGISQSNRSVQEILRSAAVRWPIFGVICLCFLFGGFIYAQSSIQVVSPGDELNYRIGVGDVLKVVVLKQTILSQDDVRVGNEGTIRLPMIEEPIPANCLTEAELAASITERYKKYLLNPQVYVAVKEFNANPVAVVGSVNSAGRFQLKRPMRLLELLTFVNGPSSNAGKNVQIIRSGGMGCESRGIETLGVAAGDGSPQEMISLPLAEVLKGSENSNPFIQGGDIVRIPEAEQKQAFVIGNVKSAVIVNLKEPVTLTRAIAMAGGVSGGADTGKIKISRQSADGLSKIEIVSLKDINNQKKDDIVLQANDIVDVPGVGGVRKVLKDIVTTIIPTITRGVRVIP